MRVSDVRAHFRAVIERVKKGEEVTLTQNGEPVAKIVALNERPSRWRPETLEAAGRTLKEIREARSRPFDIGPGISVERGEQIIREIRAERDEE
ncbi:MAG TPA: type II toxin-antitoxin system prevent-host-death family antitoxin [Dehalococcoidia bacterium]|nr:type II toxin-antitoxin system prevent-host-death family antitoxin [Dehalococcoidia bacterium]